MAEQLNLLTPGHERHSRIRPTAARRVANATRWLIAEGLLARTDRARVQLLSETGSKQPYRRETDEELESRMAHREAVLGTVGSRYIRSTNAWEGPPIKLPITFWSEGWLSMLSASAIAFLLVLCDQGESTDAPVQVPRIVTSQYALSKEVWARGRTDLVACGLVERHRVGTAGAVPRWEYVLNRERLLGSAV